MAKPLDLRKELTRAHRAKCETESVPPWYVEKQIEIAEKLRAKIGMSLQGGTQVRTRCFEEKLSQKHCQRARINGLRNKLFVA